MMPLFRSVLSSAPALAVYALGSLAVPSHAQQRGPTLEDLFTVNAIGGVTLSPDGRTVLYTVNESDLEENETDIDIWLVRRDGEAWADPVQMTRNPANETRPRWRPDGRAFAFLSSRDGESDGAQERKLFLMRVSGGEPEELLGHTTSIQAFEWSPDGRFIAFTAQDEESDEEKEADEKGRDVIIENEPMRYSHLWLLDVDTREARRLTEGVTYTVGSFDWSPSGGELAFTARPTNLPPDRWHSDIYAVVTSDSLAPRRLTDNPGPDANPVWTPDGRHIVFQRQEADSYRVGYARAHRIAATGGEAEDISPRMDVQAGAYTFTQDGRSVFFESTTGTTRGVFYMPLDTREPVRLTPESGVYGGASYSADRRNMALTYQSPERASEVYVASIRATPRAHSVRADKMLTQHNTHASEWAVGKTEVLRWKGADGREVEGIVVLPAGWTPGAGPRATVVKIHGGPSGVYVQNFQAASTGADAQRYAADGYVVLLPNPRGSSGYGEAGLQAVVEDWGGLDFQDIMAGVDTLVARGIAHPDSLGVMGWSYGGYMTAWTVTQTTRFHAAVAGAAITENIAMWGTQDIMDVFEGYFGGGPYEPDRWQVYQRSNPLAFIDRARTPTLILHGQNDPRVPPNQARIFYRALRANGVPASLVWLPRTGHGPREPGLRYETARRQKEWMDRWIRRKSAQAATSEGGG